MKIFDIDKDLFKSDSEIIEILEHMTKDVEKFCSEFHDDPKSLSDWGHNYFCPEDGARLIFDFDKPHEHECSLCHTVYKSKLYDDVWTYFYRNEAILNLMKLAVLYKTEGKIEYLSEYKRILGFYSDNYTKFDLHAKSEIVYELTKPARDIGRLMPQGLNESIVIIRICMTLELLKDDLEQEFLDGLEKNLFNPAMELLSPQINKVHNKPCWLCSAVGIVGFVTGNQKLIDQVFKDKFGINDQMRLGVTGDKFWYEGSTHYNFFLLEGICYLLAFSKLYGQEFETSDIVEDMLIQAYHFAFDNDVLPNPNDGWPDINLKSYSYIYCLATKVFGEDSTVGKIYKHILADPKPRVEIPLSKPFYFENKVSFEHLVCLPNLKGEANLAPKRKSFCFTDSYFSMLKNDKINFFMKYGHRGPAHAHPDKMNVEIAVNGHLLSRDLSNTGYASKLCNEWHRKTICHNTVVVDGLNHVSMEGGTMLEFNDNLSHAKVENVYDGVDFTRRCTISENGFTDDFKVESSKTHNYDWFFHSEAKLLTKIDGSTGDLGFNQNGYEHVKDLIKINCENELILEWDLHGTKLTSTFDTKGLEVFTAQTYDNPVSKYRTAIIMRSKSENADFSVKWTIN
ncbi:MAG: heparinase II/III family protein [Clostridia bacterium]